MNSPFAESREMYLVALLHPRKFESPVVEMRMRPKLENSVDGSWSAVSLPLCFMLVHVFCLSSNSKFQVLMDSVLHALT